VTRGVGYRYVTLHSADDKIVLCQLSFNTAQVLEYSTDFGSSY